MNTITFFHTTDLPLATYLRCKRVQLQGDYSHKSKEWTFSDEDTCKKLSLELANGNALVDVLEYEMHRKNLLSLAKRNNKE
jgi:hypothetical protein